MKHYCKKCKILLFETGFANWYKNNPTKTIEYYEYEDGNYCKNCSIHKRTREE